MSLLSINFLHLTLSEIWPRQDFIRQGHYGKVKGQIKVTPWCCTPTPPNQCLHQVSTSFTLRFLRYSPDKIFKLKVTMARSKVKSRSDHDVAHLHLLTNVPTKYPAYLDTMGENNTLTALQGGSGERWPSNGYDQYGGRSGYKGRSKKG